MKIAHATLLCALAWLPACLRAPHGATTAPDGGAGGSACATVPRPAAGGNTGLFVFGVDAGVDPCSIGGYMVGQSALFTVQAADNGTYFIDKVPPGTHDFVLTGKRSPSPLRADVQGTLGVRLGGVQTFAGKAVDQGPIDLPATGTLVGKVTLSGATDHSGVDVYVPGTSYQAKTDTAGNYTIDAVPAGIQEIYFHASGYALGQVEGFAVASAQTANVPDMTLIVSTGASGTLQVAGGAKASPSPTVPVVVAATPNAILMKLSEDPAFVNVPWTPLLSSTTFTFAGDGPRTLYVQFADANGLSSSPFSAAIMIDTTAPVVTGFKPKVGIYNRIEVPVDDAYSITMTADDGNGTGVTAYQLYQGGAQASAVWQPWTPTAGVQTISLPASPPGTQIRQLCARARDALQHVSDERCGAVNLWNPSFVPDAANHSEGTSFLLDLGGQPLYVAQSFTAPSALSVIAIGIGGAVSRVDVVTLNADGGGRPGAIVAQCDYVETAYGPLEGPGSNVDGHTIPYYIAVVPQDAPTQLSSGTRYWIVWRLSDMSAPYASFFNASNTPLAGEALMQSTDGSKWTSWTGPATPTGGVDYIASLYFLLL